MTAPAVAAAMVRAFGENAHDMIRRHIARCLEEELVDEVEFWLRVRNRAEMLQRDETLQKDEIVPQDRKAGDQIVLEAWLRDALRRMAGGIVAEPIPDALLRLLGPPLPEGDPD